MKLKKGRNKHSKGGKNLQANKDTMPPEMVKDIEEKQQKSKEETSDEEIEIEFDDFVASKETKYDKDYDKIETTNMDYYVKEITDDG